MRYCWQTPFYAQNKVAVVKPRVGAGKVSAMQLNMVKGEIEKALTRKGFPVVSRSEVDALVKDFDFEAVGKLTDKEQESLSHLEGVDYLCFATISNEGNEYYITAKLVSKQSGTISNPASIYMEGGLNQLNTKSDDLAEELSILYGRTRNALSNDRGKISGNTYTEEALGLNMQFVRVQGGSFVMGCTENQGSDCESDETPAHNVQVGTFYIGVYEVTQAQWQRVMGTGIVEQQNRAGASSLRGVGDNYPMYYITWEEANNFARELSRITGKTYRLPTEAEWEYAARGGNKHDEAKYAGSHNINAVAWYAENGDNITHPVGQKRPNALGIYDMSGNVWEWCSDWYGPYQSGYQENPTGAETGSRHVDRGGGWFNDSRYCRVSLRFSRPPSFRGSFLGLRLVLVP